MVKVKSITIGFIVVIMSSDPSDNTSDEEEDSEKKNKKGKSQKKETPAEKKKREMNFKKKLRAFYAYERKKFEEVVNELQNEGHADTDSDTGRPKLHYRWLYKDGKKTENTEPQSVDYTKRMKRWLKHTENTKKGRFFYSDISKKAIKKIPDKKISLPESIPEADEKLRKSEFMKRDRFHKKLMDLAKNDESKKKNYLWYKWRNHIVQDVKKVPVNQDVVDKLKEVKKKENIKIWKRDPGVLGGYVMSDDDETDHGDFMRKALGKASDDTETEEDEEEKKPKPKVSSTTKKSKIFVKKSSKKKSKKVSSSEESEEEIEMEGHSDNQDEETDMKTDAETEEDSGLLSEVPKKVPWYQELKKLKSTSAAASKPTKADHKKKGTKTLKSLGVSILLPKKVSEKDSKEKETPFSEKGKSVSSSAPTSI